METWSSRRGFILAAIGSAVGIGNIWRFSAVLGQNGGGAYLVPYLVAVFLFALPLMILEFAVGRRLRTNVVGAFRRLDQRFEIAGWLIATIVFTILSYYLVITGWTLAYFLQAVRGEMADFGEFSAGYAPLFVFAISGVAVGAITSFGVRGGIERTATMLMPLAFLILLALAIYAVTLDGFGAALTFMFEPDFSALGEPGLWSAALGQAFFSLSVGFGILLTYGSYVSRETDIVGAATIITVADLTVALLAGLVIFPVVFTFGLEPAAGAELAFSTLPAAFEQMPAGRLLAPAFFLLLFAAGLTSAVSMMEMNVAAVVEKTGIDRRRVSVILTVLVIGLGLPSALSYTALELQIFGWRVLDLLDDTVGRLGLPVGALLIAFFFTRRLPVREVLEEFGVTAGLTAGVARMRSWLLPMLRYAIPAALVVVTATTVLAGLDPAAWGVIPTVEGMSGLGQLVVTVLLGAALLASTLVVVTLLRRWLAARTGGA
jgi:neurotransmitter:Na+ symporter, NSS family